MSHRAGSACDIADPEPGFKAAVLIEAVHPWILAAALQQHVVAILYPGRVKRGRDDGPSVTAPTTFGVRHDIL